MQQRLFYKIKKAALCAAPNAFSMSALSIFKAPKMPALVVFNYGGYFSLLQESIEIT
jgi:hypothetical protein